MVGSLDLHAVRALPGEVLIGAYLVPRHITPVLMPSLHVMPRHQWPTRVLGLVVLIHLHACPTRRRVKKPFGRVKPRPVTAYYHLIVRTWKAVSQLLLPRAAWSVRQLYECSISGKCLLRGGGPAARRRGGTAGARARAGL